MSESKLISPLLDGFTMGNPMSDHDGVRCCPAMKENTDEKYIVKIISIPASQVQLDALLLTGAYKDPADAMDYFKDVADGIAKEASILKNLSKLEGFLSYEDWQIVPMEKGKLGYEVYLLGSYKRSLERYMRRHLMTHLEAVNLGLDLCQALAICRRAGYMYVDLKPANIFISKGKEYRIGDLGFVDLNSLQFTSLPGRYRSPYAPPETQDALKTLNQTVDTYGVGMVLYQIFNDGQLPKVPENPGDVFPSPANADYELAEIIAKAIAPKQEDRWQNPMEMGQALVAYMQRNTVNNTPLAPPLAVLENAEPISESKPSAEEPPYMDGIIEEEAVSSAIEEEPSTETMPEEETEKKEIPEIPVSSEASDSSDSAVMEVTYEEDEDDDFLRLLSDELGTTGELDKTDEDEDSKYIEENPLSENEKKSGKDRKPIGKGWILPFAVLLILAILGCGAFFFYQNYYLQTINHLSVDGTQNQLTVTVDTDVDDSILNIRCTDTYGNTNVQSVVNGQAVFTDLLPDSLYRIELEVTGFHKLVGKTSEIFTTDALTNVVSFTSITGPEDGSVMLNFNVDGSDPEEWVLTYSTDGEETKTHNFTGHSVTIKGLTVGKTYTFQLGSSDGMEVLGATTLEFKATRLVMADDLTIVSSENGSMTVRWTQPEDVVIESWVVRCYNDDGHEEVKEVTENEVVFSGIDSSVAYTVEVTASGMTQPARTSISANPITVSNITVNEDDIHQLSVSWEHAGTVPEGGWLVMYTLDESETQNVVKCSEANAVISPRIHGATYHIEIQAADGTSIFGNLYQYECPNVGVYEGNGLSAEKITAYLLKTPEGDWTYESVGNEAFTDEFSAGDNISVVLRSSANFYLPNEDINVMYVIRDSAGNVQAELTSQETIDWNALWFDGDYHAGELNIPKVPTEAGDYSVSIYFNNAAVTSTTFTITE